MALKNTGQGYRQAKAIDKAIAIYVNTMLKILILANKTSYLKLRRSDQKTPAPP